MDHPNDPMTIELARIEAELDLQNRALAELFDRANTAGDVVLAVSRHDLAAVADVCRERSSTPIEPNLGLRC